MHWDGTITLGSMIAAASICSAVLGSFYSLRSRMDSHEKLFKVITENHDRRLTELESIARNTSEMLNRLIGRQDWDGSDRRFK